MAVFCLEYCRIILVPDMAAICLPSEAGTAVANGGRGLIDHIGGRIGFDHKRTSGGPLLDGVVVLIGGHHIEVEHGPCHDAIIPGIILNGGITSLEDTQRHLQAVDGVMIGRAAYQNPYLLARAGRQFSQPDAPLPSRHQVIERLLPYVEAELAAGTRLQQISRHLLGLFQGQPGARAWRRYLSEHAHCDGAGVEVLEQALARVPDPVKGEGVRS